MNYALIMKWKAMSYWSHGLRFWYWCLSQFFTTYIVLCGYACLVKVGLCGNECVIASTFGIGLSVLVVMSCGQWLEGFQGAYLNEILDAKRYRFHGLNWFHSGTYSFV